MASHRQYSGIAPAAPPHNDAPEVPERTPVQKASRIFALATAMQAVLPDGQPRNQCREIKALALSLMAQVRAGR